MEGRTYSFSVATNPQPEVFETVSDFETGQIIVGLGRIESEFGKSGGAVCAKPEVGGHCNGDEDEGDETETGCEGADAARHEWVNGSFGRGERWLDSLGGGGEG